MDKLIELFCIVDDFCKEFMPEFDKHLLNESEKIMRTSCSMAMSEIMTIIIYFHQSHYRDFKGYFQNILRQHLKHFFPKLLSYNRFVEVKKSASIPLIFFYSVSV